MGEATKGPWELQTTAKHTVQAFTRGHWHEISSPDYADPIAEVYDTDDTFGSESLANARLIAASPDLLEALEECLREHGGFTIKGECERKARAAIAKARGEVA
ncbi:hypothetical protein [Qipengyuania atrilutea]|uniref:Uncharacterized protein n=1 Tax=Qipengyuania atrilutea TaxID=2744473 RepID=A0A850H5F1_9SPHN|nr:hypothetical protein [Actirhodobacter atriluteus]NVD44355.1 hypothetical protein [Actirhodobacter atriluteus]